ncbi:MAG: CpsD/CapB family tyrosine-protein kinase [Nitrospira sp.]|nr:CpsD/CapB family tyrosine-protein kinase [Nitrospira sp.]
MDYLQHAQERFRQQTESAGGDPRRLDGDSRRSDAPIVYRATKTIALPDHVMREQRLITGFDEGPFVDAYRVLRAQVLQQYRQKGWNVIGVSSPTAQEGKTLTAVNLSLSLAMDLAHTVLLVDADLHRPTIHRFFGIGHVPGLTEYLFDNAPLAQLLIHPGIGRCVFLSGGRSIRNSAEALASPRMTSLVHELKHRYPARLVVFDLPPLLSRADAVGFVSNLDAMVLVLEEGRTVSEEVEQAMDLVKGTVPILGGVLNKSGRGMLTLRQGRKLVNADR